MKLSIQISDEAFDRLEAVAKEQGTTPTKLISTNLDSFLKLNPQENQILLGAKHLDELSQTVGGKLFRSPEDVVKLVKDSANISVGGVMVEICPEDAHALRDQFTSTSYQSYEKYIADSVNESLALYLHGSTRGILAY